MTIETQSFTPPSGVNAGSDVEALHYSDGTLNIVLACSQDDEQTVRGITIKFFQPAGFRLLDELDLARYWNSADFSRGSHVLEVESGGWSAEEDHFQLFETMRREWLVATGNACVSVFCSSEPEVTDISWEREVKA